MDLQHDPRIFSILLLLGLGGITALVLAFLGNLLASWLNVRLRLKRLCRFARPGSQQKTDGEHPALMPGVREHGGPLVCRKVRYWS